MLRTSLIDVESSWSQVINSEKVTLPLLAIAHFDVNVVQISLQKI